MPTVITHAAVPLCLGAGLGLKVMRRAINAAHPRDK